MLWLQISRQNRQQADCRVEHLEPAPPITPGCNVTSDRRFTILEGLLAMVLLAILLIAAAPLFCYGHVLMRRSALKRRAVEVGTQKMESLINVGFDQVQNDQSQIDLGGLTATCTTTVLNTFIDGDGEGYKQVRVTLNWTVGERADEIVLTTYVSSAAPTG